MTMEVKKIMLFLFVLGIYCMTNAQENNKNGLKVGGFIQTDLEIVQKEGRSNMGSNPLYDKKRDGADKDYFVRYGVRRGGIRIAYSQKKVTGVFELDLSEGGLYPKAAVINVSPNEWIEINTGLQPIWFGEEVAYPTPKQEVLEHCNLLRNLFFLDRDIGMKISLKSPINWLTNGLKLDIGFVSGNGINRVSDSKINVVGHLKYERNMERIYLGVGCSFYSGKVHNMIKEIITVPPAFVVATPYQNIFSWEEKLSRTYFGIDAQCHFNIASLGTTEIKGEYIWGIQPSQKESFRSPNNDEYSNLPNYAFCLKRKFNGGYLYLFQNVGQLPLRLLFKYVWSNPNIDLKSEEKQFTSDVNCSTFGFGCQWNITKGLHITGIYHVNTNEHCNNLPSYTYDRKDNNLTLRMQYEF